MQYAAHALRVLNAGFRSALQIRRSLRRAGKFAACVMG